MNKVILMGRLTRDPDVRYSGNGESSMTIARFTVAVDRRRTNADGQRDADFIGCVAFGKQAEFAEKYLHQGSKIALTGRIQTGSYSNKDGQKVYTTDVVAEDIEFAESKAAADQRTGGYAQPGPGYSRAPQYQQPQPQYQQPQYQAPAQQPQGYGPAVSPQQPANDFAPAEDAASQVGQGFMNIPEGVEDEGLPFN